MLGRTKQYDTKGALTLKWYAVGTLTPCLFCSDTMVALSTVVEDTCKMVFSRLALALRVFMEAQLTAKQSEVRQAHEIAQRGVVRSAPLPHASSTRKQRSRSLPWLVLSSRSSTDPPLGRSRLVLVVCAGDLLMLFSSPSLSCVSH